MKKEQDNTQIWNLKDSDLEKTKDLVISILQSKIPQSYTCIYVICFKDSWHAFNHTYKGMYLQAIELKQTRMEIIDD